MHCNHELDIIEIVELHFHCPKCGYRNKVTAKKIFRREDEEASKQEIDNKDDEYCKCGNSKFGGGDFCKDCI